MSDGFRDGLLRTLSMTSLVTKAIDRRIGMLTDMCLLKRCHKFVAADVNVKKVKDGRVEERTSGRSDFRVWSFRSWDFRSPRIMICELSSFVTSPTGYRRKKNHVHNRCVTFWRRSLHISGSKRTRSKAHKAENTQAQQGGHSVERLSHLL